MAFVGEAVLSASVQMLVEKIASHDFLAFFRSEQLDVSLLRKLKITLLALQALLNDAEEKQITNPAVKEWLDELTDAVFDAEDLLDKINTEALRCKVEGLSQSQPFSHQVRNFLSSPFKRFKGTTNSEISALLERLEQFVLLKDILGLKEGVSSSVWHGTPSSSVVDESAICGRDDDKMKLKSYLLSEDASGSGSKIGVISIVGMGGIGKTTLAKLLYNDPEVKDKFDLKAWAYISKDFDVCRVTKTLLEAVSSKQDFSNNLNTLQVELQQSLSHKRYLLVLDDIWDGSYDDWTNLKAIFNAGEMGSKIIITTRDENVAKTMKTFLPIHYMRSLSSEDCWSLLATHAFGSNNCGRDSNLEEIGKEIAKKCGGLPLAAKAIGGLLGTKASEKEWKKVLKSNIWDLPNVNVLPALLLSYHYLPSPLKRCFAYCSIFSKNSKIEKWTVVQLWIAEGLVHQSKSEKTMEEVGDEYFDELVSRSMIGRGSAIWEGHFVMHDLINDLATMVSAAYCIRNEDKKPHESLERIRHLSYKRGTYDNCDKFDTFSEAKSLRSFLALSSWDNGCYLSNKVVQDLLPAMRKLRVLSLSHYRNVTELPCSLLENLIHLRYLNLSYTKIERLPDSTCKLYNLQTLLLYTCQCLTELPKDMGKLVNLRHLDIRWTKLKEMPLQIAELQNLQTLSTFIVSKQQDGLKIGELRKFSHLQGTLSILKLQNVIDPSDAFEANLKKKEQIDELGLGWDRHIAEDSEIERLVLEQLQPSTNLKRLTIEFYGGTRFPNWLGDSSFGNMVYLCIRHCDHCWSLPPLGQLLSLKELCICRMKSVKTVGSEFYGSCTPSFQPFPSLQTLSFNEMPDWEEWNLTGGTTTEFPRLESLWLNNCPLLKGNLPSNLPSLERLELSNCPLLKGNLPSNLPSLDSLELYNCPLLKGNLPSNLPSLERLSLNNCPLLKGNLPSNLPSLERLELNNCPLLKGNLPSNLPSLHSLELNNCPLLVSGDGDEVDNSNIRRPSDLDWMMLTFNSLQEYFPRDGLPTTLQSLSIIGCENVEFLPLETLHSYTSLEDLDISNSCCSMTSFTLGCKNLKSISIAEEDPSRSLSFLQGFYIRNCPELESFPDGGLPTPNLIGFEVENCEKLNLLPEPINTLSGLQELVVCGLPKLQSFAEEGLPINLRKLDIGNDRGDFTNTAMSEWGLQCLTNTAMSEWGLQCLTNTAMSKWGLQCLTCLSELRLSGDNIVNALMKINVPLLPTSLVSLYISRLSATKCLDGKWLQHLTSLENLEILEAPTLESLPEEGLPSSLSVLTIKECPLLEASYQKEKRGKEWAKIAHIPFIIINYQAII